MFCGRCGAELGAEARFCSACGAPASAAAWQSGPSMSRLVRPRTGRVIAGVCAGIAQQYGWELVWVRVVAVLLAVFSSGAGIVAYIVFWIVMPEQPGALPSSTVTSAPPPPV